jgi:hypothetical protein
MAKTKAIPMKPAQPKPQEQKYRKLVRLSYKLARRNGLAKGPARVDAVARTRRLFAGFALLEASEYKLDPIQLAANLR